MSLALYILLSLVFRFFGVVQDVLSFDTQTLTTAGDLIGLPVAYIVIALAGLSEGLGRTSVVLLVNRLSRRAFLLHVVLSGMVFVIGAVMLIGIIWLLAYLLFDASRPFLVVVRFLGLGYLPLVWSFFVLVPCLGPGVRVLVGVWSVGIMVVIGAWLFSLAVWQACVCIGGGWLVVQLLHRLLKGPGTVVQRQLWSLTTGSPTGYAIDELPCVLPVRTLGMV